MSRHKTWKTYNDILFGRSSLGLLTSRFPGYLLSEETVMQYLKPAIPSGKVRAISFEINYESCVRLQKYYVEYQARGFDRQYSGFTSNLYLGEGAGCAAFAISFLQVAGVLDTYFQKSWSRQLSVPFSLLPEGGNPPTFWGYMLGIEESWATKNEKALSLTIYDPEKIYDWVFAQTNERHISPVRSKLVLVENALELVVDSQDVTSTENYWGYSWPPSGHKAENTKIDTQIK
ncbi:MAG: hypothetical protein IT287_01200 [Bdellovibrionaceae bacterium]|nr:hypothetical protein [Pseudobdellovibrionaceae bacterium]